MVDASFVPRLMTTTCGCHFAKSHVLADCEARMRAYTAGMASAEAPEEPRRAFGTALARVQAHQPLEQPLHGEALPGEPLQPDLDALLERHVAHLALAV